LSAQQLGFFPAFPYTDKAITGYQTRQDSRPRSFLAICYYITLKIAQSFFKPSQVRSEIVILPNDAAQFTSLQIQKLSPSLAGRGRYGWLSMCE
jgi:hypothetical protein